MPGKYIASINPDWFVNCGRDEEKKRMFHFCSPADNAISHILIFIGGQINYGIMEIYAPFLRRIICLLTLKT